MGTYRFININGVAVENKALEKHLEKIASNHITIAKSVKQTYPIPRMKEKLHWIVEPNIDKTKLFNCIVSMDNLVKSEPGEFFVTS